MTTNQTQAARADEFARVKVRLSALVASLDETVERGTHAEEFDQGAAHASAVTARQMREILNDTALGVTPGPVTEHATRYPGGAYHVRWADPRVEKLHPLAEWIENEQRQGSKVYRRRIIVVEDWAEVQA